MGTKCHIVVEGGRKGLLDVGVDRVRSLETDWTRFDAGSEVSRVNVAGPKGLHVSHDTFALFQVALAADSITAGACDSFMARDIEVAGYDRDFSGLRSPNQDPGRAEAGGAVRRRLSVREGARRAGIRLLDRRRRLVRLPSGYAFDSGGIGKGLAADLVTQTLQEQGAVAVLVNLGGDLRVRGRPQQGGWEIGISDEVGSRQQEISVKLASGGLCTSSQTRRRWVHNGQVFQHLLDPRTGGQLDSRWAAATVIAPQAWLAEALSKAALQLNSGQLDRLLGRHFAGVIQQNWDGAVRQGPSQG